MKRQEDIFWHPFPSAVLSPDSCYHCHFSAGVGILPTALTRISFLPAAQPKALLRTLHSHPHSHLQPHTLFLYSSFSIIYYLCFQRIRCTFFFFLVLLSSIQVLSLFNKYTYLSIIEHQLYSSCGLPQHSSFLLLTGRRSICLS